MKTLSNSLVKLLLATVWVTCSTPSFGDEPKAKPVDIQSAPSSEPRQKMVVVEPIKISEDAGVSGTLSARVLVNLHKNLVTDFVKSRKFAVLDREFGDQINAEKHSRDTDRSEASRTVKLGGETTADYLIASEVKRFTNSHFDQEMQLSGRKIPRFAYDLSVAVQVIDVATRRVVFADSFDEKASGILQADPYGFDLWADNATAAVATKVCQSVLELIYPLKVASVLENGEVVLNEGAGRVVEGDVYEVYALGKVMTDPDSGVEIGREETLQTKIKVSRVLPKASYAQALLPTPAAIRPGSICRKVKAPKLVPETKPEDSTEAEKTKKVKVDDDL